MVINDISFLLIASLVFGWQGVFAMVMLATLLWYTSRTAYWAYFHLRRQLPLRWSSLLA